MEKRRGCEVFRVSLGSVYDPGDAFFLGGNHSNRMYTELVDCFLFLCFRVIKNSYILLEKGKLLYYNNNS